MANLISFSDVSGIPWVRTFEITTGAAPMKLELPLASRFLVLENGDLGQLGPVTVDASGMTVTSTQEDIKHNIYFDYLLTSELAVTISSLTAMGVPLNQIIQIPYPPGGMTEQEFVDAVNAAIIAAGLDLSFATTNPGVSIVPQDLEDSTSVTALVVDVGATGALQFSLTEGGFNTGDFWTARAKRTLPPLQLKSRELWLRAIKPDGVANDYSFKASIIAGLSVKARA
jgi:hypothetical protein